MDLNVGIELATLQIFEGDLQRRGMVEAWLLSGQSDAELGQRLGLEPAAAERASGKSRRT